MKIGKTGEILNCKESMEDALFPKIKKLEDFLNEEEGNISKEKVLMVGSILACLYSQSRQMKRNRTR